MKIFARHSLVHDNLRTAEPALLLEGTWPAAHTRNSRRDLDEAIDGRFTWIDSAAAEAAEQLGRDGLVTAIGPSNLSVNFAWLNALKLRYALVKLLRLVAYFEEVATVRPGQTVELWCQRGPDAVYFAALEALAARWSFRLVVHWSSEVASATHDRPQRTAPRDGALRQAAQRWLNDSAPDPLLPTWRSQPLERVVLCGDPKWLDPVCTELLHRGVSPWWLYDRFAIRSWWRWHTDGVRQLVCNSSQGTAALREDISLTRPLMARGVELTSAAECWLGRLAADVAPRQATLLQRIATHFEQVRPTHLVLDQDATPLARAVVAAAAKFEATTQVVQHGVPAVRLGFAPLATQRLCAWDAASREQFTAWDVPRQQVLVTGSPWHEQLARQQRTSPRAVPGNRTEILLLAPVPPRDDRPDAVGWHLTAATYEQMLRQACAAVVRLPQARLTIKLHPRADQDAAMQRVLADFPSLDQRIIRRGDARRWAGKYHCVLSCGSGGGYEARLVGLPVVQLLPQGSADCLPAASWGLLGTARTAAELHPLLSEALASWRFNTGGQAARGIQAAARIVDCLLSDEMPSDVNSQSVVPLQTDALVAAAGSR